MRKTIIFIFCLVLLFFNFNTEIKGLLLQLNSFDQMKRLLLIVITIYCYTLPVTLLLNYKMQVISFNELLWFILNGSFIAGTFSYYLIYQLDNFIIKNSSISLLGAALEEVLKALAFILAFFLIYKKNKYNILNIFAFASLLGLGFQMYEDYIYFLNSVDQGSIIFLKSMFERLSNSISSHWMYTGITSFGIITLLEKNITKSISMLLLISPAVLHIIWNSSWNNSTFISSILSAITVYLYFYSYKTAYDYSQNTNGFHFKV